MQESLNAWPAVGSAGPVPHVEIFLSKSIPLSPLEHERIGLNLPAASAVGDSEQVQVARSLHDLVSQVRGEVGYVRSCIRVLRKQRTHALTEVLNREVKIDGTDYWCHN